jgi:4-carboxymuconolactone decarboxylase
MNRSLPPDVDAHSRCRLPLPSRASLDEAGQKAYDRATGPGKLAGLQGPAGLQLHSPGVRPHLSALNTYLRFDAGFTPRVREIAILATAREMESQFEWVPAEVIAAIRDRASLDGLDEEDAAVIELARQLWRDHKVTPALFASLNARYGARMLLDLTVLMGTYANTAAMLALVDMQIPADRSPSLPVR